MKTKKSLFLKNTAARMSAAARKAELAALKALSERTPEEWLKSVRMLKDSPVRVQAACVVWWDWFSNRPADKAWGHLKEELAAWKARCGEKGADPAAVRAALLRLGYPERLSILRSRCEDEAAPKGRAQKGRAAKKTAAAVLLAAVLSARPASAGRPLTVDDAEPVPAGAVEAECGAAFSRGGDSRSWNIPAGVSYGLLPGTEIGASLGAAIESGGPGRDASASGPSLGVKTAVCDGTALAPSVTLPSDGEDAEAGLTAIASRALSKRVGIHANAGLALPEGGAAAPYPERSVGHSESKGV